MTHKSLVLIVVCLLLASVAWAQTMPAQTKSAPAATGVPDKALMQTILDAWGTMNLDAVGKYYDHSPTNVFYDVAPLKFNGWDEYVTGVKPGFSSLKSLKFTIDNDAAVHRSGNVAWGTCTVKTAMTDKTDKVTNFVGRWTVIWEKKGDNWVITHDHFSAPMPETM